MRYFSLEQLHWLSAEGKDDDVHGVSSQAPRDRSSHMSLQRRRFPLVGSLPLLQASWPGPTGTTGTIWVSERMNLPLKLPSGRRGCRGVWGYIPPIAAPCSAPPWAKISKDRDPTPCPAPGSTCPAGKRIVLLFNGNFLHATHATASYSISGIPKKLGCGFPACLQLDWICVPTDGLATHESAAQTCVCSLKPPCQSNVSLWWGRLIGLSLPVSEPPPLTCIPSENMVREGWGCLQPCAGGAGAPMAPGCQDKAGAAATLCPTHCPCRLLRGTPCLAGTWARA